MQTRERMPEVLVAIFAVAYAAAGSGLMAAGAVSVCQDESRQTAGEFCAQFVRGWHWPVLVLSEHAFGRELTVLERVLSVILIFGLSALTFAGSRSDSSVCVNSGQPPIIAQPCTCE